MAQWGNGIMTAKRRDEQGKFLSWLFAFFMNSTYLFRVCFLSVEVQAQRGNKTPGDLISEKNDWSWSHSWVSSLYSRLNSSSLWMRLSTRERNWSAFTSFWNIEGQYGSCICVKLCYIFLCYIIPRSSEWLPCAQFKNWWNVSRCWRNPVSSCILGHCPAVAFKAYCPWHSICMVVYKQQ
jgi:hypothetical protein